MATEEKKVQNNEPPMKVDDGKGQKLLIIPKIEVYVEYMLDVIGKLPKVEKYSIGNEFKTTLYQLIKEAMYLSKVDRKYALDILNRIDAELNIQRMYLRIMQRHRWIDNKKFEVAMGLIYEIGKILGGLIKFYAKK